jgi:shikimate kinase
MNIFLVGPMGSGKSSLGKKLAKSLDKKFIDTDKEIEKKEKKTINEIFENNGEKYFREKEKEFLINISNSLNVVIATGGGIVTDRENREKLKENKVIFLNASVERQTKRTSRSDKRPLLKNVDRLKKLRELYEERLKFYKEVSSFEINVDKYKNKDILVKIIEELNENN